MAHKNNKAPDAQAGIWTSAAFLLVGFGFILSQISAPDYTLLIRAAIISEIVGLMLCATVVYIGASKAFKVIIAIIAAFAGFILFGLIGRL